MSTITATAVEIERCLAADPPDRHEALRWVAQLVVDFERVTGPERRGLVAEEPASTGDPRWDAMLAAVTEHLCFHHGLEVPAWSLNPSRFLDEW